MAFKLFDTIKLEVEKKINEFKYELKQPEEIDKSDMIKGLQKIMTLPTDVQHWLPDKVILQKFKIDRTTTPDTFVLGMEIDPPDIFQPFTNILFLKTAAFEVETNHQAVGSFENG